MLECESNKIINVEMFSKYEIELFCKLLNSHKKYNNIK